MKNPTLLVAALLATISFSAPFSACNPLGAAEITFFGDFEDGFGGVSYDSADLPLPGSIDLNFDAVVVGIPKFDPSLGTLTDITVFVEDPAAIFYTIMGGISAEESDPGLPDFTAEVTLFGDVGVNYETTTTIHSIIVDDIELMGFCGGFSGEGSCGDALFSTGDGVLEGVESIFTTVDLVDFVGPGDVDSLFVQLFLESTATFDLTNATATATVDYDVFDGDSGADDPVIGVTYTYTPVPEPTSLLLTASALAWLGVMRRRT